jgi:hypothetical protein
MVEMKTARTIVVLSVGNRPWLDHLRPYIEQYAAKCRAVPEISIYDELPEKYAKRLKFIPWRLPRHLAQLSKVLLVSDALKKYDRVLLLDDTCFVAPGTPDIFDLVPNDHLGGVADGGVLGKLNYPRPVMNTGVLCASAVHRCFYDQFEDFHRAFVEDKITGDQHLINRVLATGAMDHVFLDARLNVVGSRINESTIQDKQAYIYHLTSALTFSKRLEYAQLLCQRYPL